MKGIRLSYIITTYNKLNYLRIIISELLSNLKEDEEIIVIDGGSSDGTKDFLKGLFEKNQIDFYISEQDKGEAHGFNKGIWLSKGELIKIITDDDAFHYRSIEKCKYFMLANKQYDILGANTGNVNIQNYQTITYNEDYEKDFLEWKEGRMKNFFFNGTCLLIRRSSLPLLGLFNTGVLLNDFEYTLRISGVANIAWYTGIVSVRILNSNSNNLLFEERAKHDSEKLCEYYDYKYPDIRKKKFKKKMLVLKKIVCHFRKLKNEILRLNNQVSENQISFTDAHSLSIEWLDKHPLNINPHFL